MTHAGPELAILADTIHTLSEQRGITALGITDGRVTHLGTREEADGWGARRVVDHGAATLVPGLVDAHIHPVHGQSMARGVFLGDAATPEEVGAILAEGAEGAASAGGWVLGWGLKQTVFGERAPEGRFLERFLPGVRVHVMFFDGHASIASPAALAAAGVAQGGPVPGGGEIVADAEGRPTGFLVETTAMERVLDVVPPMSFEEKTRAVLATFEGMAAAGLTGGEVLDLEDPDSIAVLEAIEERGELPLRLRVAPWILSKHGPEQLERVLALQGRAGRRFLVRGAKLMIDGTIDNGSAWLHRPDAYGEGTHGHYSEPERYLSTLRTLHEAGVTTTTHAIGDRGIRFVIDAIAGLPAGGPRHRIEHLEELDDEGLAALRACGAAASMQPTHCTHFLEADHSDAWSRRLGDERVDFAFRLRDVHGTGVVLALGSDWPIAPYDPREIMADARSRRRTAVPGSEPILPAQGLTALEALEGYTARVHESTGASGGRIVLGATADLTVLDADPLTITPEEMAAAGVVATYVGGERVAGEKAAAVREVAGDGAGATGASSSGASGSGA
jgi:predicted amidohydrolase YtcJ